MTERPEERDSLDVMAKRLELAGIAEMYGIARTLINEVKELREENARQRERLELWEPRGRIDSDEVTVHAESRPIDPATAEMVRRATNYVYRGPDVHIELEDDANPDESRIKQMEEALREGRAMLHALERIPADQVFVEQEEGVEMPLVREWFTEGFSKALAALSPSDTEEEA